MVESLLKMYLSNSEAPENPLDYIKVTREKIVSAICSEPLRKKPNMKFYH